MNFRVRVSRIEAKTIIVDVEADSDEDARSKAEFKAANTNFSDVKADDVQYTTEIEHRYNKHIDLFFDMVRDCEAIIADGMSLFVDVTEGEIIRDDLVISSCDEEFEICKFDIQDLKIFPNYIQINMNDGKVHDVELLWKRDMVEEFKHLNPEDPEEDQ